MTADDSPGLPGETFLLARNPATVGLARGVTRRALAGWPVDVVAVAELLVSELITNAIVHTESAPVLTLQTDAGMLRVEVEDQSPVPPRVSPKDVASEFGRGLVVVEALSASWGWTLLTPGKQTWFELTDKVTMAW